MRPFLVEIYDEHRWRTRLTAAGFRVLDEREPAHRDTEPPSAPPRITRRWDLNLEVDRG